MDLLQGVRDGAAEDPIIQEDDLQTVPHPAGDFQMPSPDKLLEILEKMNISDEEKENIREGLIKNIAHQQGQNVFMQSKLLIVTCCVLVLLLIFAFFGYKLYRSQTEKERKREEKKKQKQQKKKHK